MFFNPCLFSFFLRLGADPKFTSAKTRGHVDSFQELPEPGLSLASFLFFFRRGNKLLRTCVGWESLQYFVVRRISAFFLFEVALEISQIPALLFCVPVLPQLHILLLDAEVRRSKGPARSRGLFTTPNPRKRKNTTSRGIGTPTAE